MTDASAAGKMTRPGRKRIDLTGRRFGRWLVIAFARSAPRPGGTTTLWLCRCDCGVETEVSGHTLRPGKSSQCRACGELARRAHPQSQAGNRGRRAAVAGRDDRIRAAVVAGRPVAEIAASHGISRQRVRQILARPTD